MINQEYFQLWKEKANEVELSEQIIKVHVETYFLTQNTDCLTTLIEATQILLKEKQKEQEYYNKMFNY